ncbi:MAG: class I SAM-dependent methyltransferase [Thermoanaerobaculales bacterium]|nr:class I SAM-dependent methyltransferase [Thermoanaerobaculales bacterium]
MTEQLHLMDLETYLDKLVLSQPLRDPAIRQAIRAFELPDGSRGLDAGCGIGSHTLLLAEMLGPGGHVIGLDLSTEFVAHAQRLAEQSSLSTQVSFRQGNVNELPFDDNTFDWAWSVDCVGHPTVGEPLTAMQTLARVVRPGGQVVILGHSSQMLLPGYPLLEARLNATASTMTLLAEGMKPEAHFLRALGWFREAGFAEPTARTVVGTVHAPLDDGVRRALISLFGMLWGEMQSKMAQADREEYRRLTDPESPDFILDSPDYYAFFTYSMFEGRVARE